MSPPDVVAEHPLISIVIYGCAATAAFQVSGRAQRSAILQSLYVFSLFYLYAVYGSVAMGRASHPVAILWIALLGFVALVFHMKPLAACASNLIDGIARVCSGTEGIVRIRSYDRAEGAVARGDLDGAVLAYHEYLAEDPKDAECHRRLAELLLRKGDTPDALGEFERVVQLAGDNDAKARGLFRLAEVYQENVGDTAAARQMYLGILEECPKTMQAQYAAQRLSKLAPADNNHGDGQ